MPLSPAEVHNVAFKKPPIGKRGYDEEEVDAFLDIVEAELIRLIEENNDLRAGSGGAAAVEGTADETLTHELAAAQDDNRRLQTHIAELERSLSQGDSAQQQVVHLQQQLAQTELELNESRSQLEQAQQAAAQAQEAAANGARVAPASNADLNVQAVQILALAQQTADQHLAKSQAEADRLLTEATANAETALREASAQSEKQVGDAEARATQLDEESTSRATRTIQDAEQRAATITAQFEQRRAALERRVEELTIFEREYRSRLKSYLESQLRDLDAGANAEPVGPSLRK